MHAHHNDTLLQDEKECSIGDVAANQERPVHTQLCRRPGLAKPHEYIITSYNHPYNRGRRPSMPRDAVLERMHKSSVKLPLAASPPVDVVTIDLNGYSLKKKISKKLWRLKRTKRRLRKTRAASSQQRPVNSRLRAFVLPLRRPRCD